MTKRKSLESRVNKKIRATAKALKKLAPKGNPDYPCPHGNIDGLDCIICRDIAYGKTKGESIPALKSESDEDYVLQSESVWITVGKLSVYVKRTDEGVAVDIYPLKREAEADAIASTWATESEASES